MGPLAKIKVVEFASAGPAPFAAMMLADLGADVLTFERPQTPAPIIPKEHDMLRRGKRILTLDLKSPAGADQARDAIRNVDVLVEGFRPGAMEKLGLGPTPVFALNPRLIYGRVTGWGQSGPMARVAGHDLNFLALSGALDAIRREGEKPTIPLNMMGDFAAGGMLLTIGILAALEHVRSTGIGQVVDAAMIDGLALLMASLLGLRASGQTDTSGRNVLTGRAPWYDLYKTADGKFFSVACAERVFFANMLEALGLSAEWTDSHDRPERWDELRRQMEAAFRKKTRDKWSDVFAHIDACTAPVLSVAEAMQHPHFQVRGTFTSSGLDAQAAPAPRFAAPSRVDRPEHILFSGPTNES